MIYIGNQESLLGKFSSWHIKKSDIDEYKTRPFFHEREIWFASLGINVGYEQDGQGDKFLRPVLVLKKFSNEVLWGVPLTRSKKQGKYYFAFETSLGQSTAILSQLRLIDSKRLEYKIETIKYEDFVAIKERLRQLLV